MSQLSDDQLRSWREDGYLLLSVHLSPEEALRVERWTAELARLPETPRKWMKYLERSTVARAERLLCRIESFIPYHDAFARLLGNDATLAMLSTLMGEPAVLFKEKLNFKLPGGQGFNHHQDAPAFT